MRSFFLPNWSPPDDPARPLPAEGRPWPSDDDDDDDDDAYLIFVVNSVSGIRVIFLAECKKNPEERENYS